MARPLRRDRPGHRLAQAQQRGLVAVLGPGIYGKRLAGRCSSRHGDGGRAVGTSGPRGGEQRQLSDVAPAGPSGRRGAWRAARGAGQGRGSGDSGGGSGSSWTRAWLGRIGPGAERVLLGELLGERLQAARSPPSLGEPSLERGGPPRRRSLLPPAPPRRAVPRRPPMEFT